MTRGRKILLGLVVLVVVLVLAGVVVLPRLLDVERYRPRLEALAREKLGWPVELGEIGVSFWGGPAVVLGPVVVHDPEDRTRIEIERIAARAEFLPLLRGRLVVRDIDVLRPEVVLARAEDGFVLPALASGAEPAEGTVKAEGPGYDIQVDEIRVKGGSLAIREAGRDLVRLEEISAVVTPATRRLWGTALLAGDRGRLDWLGALGDDVTLELKDVATEALHPFLGPELVHGGGKLSGEVTITPELVVRGVLHGRGILLLAGVTPLDQVDVEFELARAGDALALDRLRVTAGGFVLRGTGPLLPATELGLEAMDVPLADALRVARAAFPLPIRVDPPGVVRLGVTVRRPDGGDLSWSAEGRLTAARVGVHVLLPVLEDVEAPFRVRRGVLRIDPLVARVAGGRFRARVVLDPVAPPGKLTVKGRAVGVDLAGLAALASPAAAKGVSGRADLDVDIGVDLSRETLGLAALRGGITVSGKEWGLPGWNLEESLLSRLAGAGGGALGGLADALGGAKALGTGGNAGTVEGTGTRVVVDRASLRLSLGGTRWKIPAFELATGDLAASGNGVLEPLDGKVDLDLSLRVARERAKELVAKWPWLKPLKQRGGPLVIPLRVEGPLLSPSFVPDLGKALGGGRKKDLEKKLKRKLEKKLGKDDRLEGVLDGLLGGRRD